MKRAILIAVFVMPFMLPVFLHATPIFINEIHYDNGGGDIDEGVEIAGTAGSDLAGWKLYLYNGNGGEVYNASLGIELSGVISDQENGYGTVSFSITGIQNGPSDGIALIDDIGTVIQFLSYEGVLIATEGPADTMTSDDIGVEETSGTGVGYSLQLTGSGSEYEDFVWASPALDSFGSVNTGQTFTAAIPEPETLFLLLIGLLLCGIFKWRVGEQLQGNDG
jgi:hypothetical protein